MEANEDQNQRVQNAKVGLCTSCIYARVIAHPHGGEPYWRCEKHDEDKSFAKYPRLPVVECFGYHAQVKDE